MHELDIFFGLIGVITAVVLVIVLFSFALMGIAAYAELECVRETWWSAGGLDEIAERCA